MPKIKEQTWIKFPMTVEPKGYKFILNRHSLQETEMIEHLNVAFHYADHREIVGELAKILEECYPNYKGMMLTEIHVVNNGEMFIVTANHNSMPDVHKNYGYQQIEVERNRLVEVATRRKERQEEIAAQEIEAEGKLSMDSDAEKRLKERRKRVKKKTVKKKIRRTRRTKSPIPN